MGCLKPMSRPAYRLLACDLDGTLLQDHNHISERVQRTVAGAVDPGVRVTLAASVSPTG